MSANDRQVAGNHYVAEIQHWDYAASHEFDYFQGQITKYVTRWKKKNGLQDLLKAQHFLEKYIELEKAKREQLKENTTIDFSNFPGIDTSQPQPYGYVNQDGQTVIKYEYKPFATDKG